MVRASESANFYLQEIRRLENDLEDARKAILQMLPDELDCLLKSYTHCESRSETYEWSRDIYRQVLAAAAGGDPDFNEPPPPKPPTGDHGSGFSGGLTVAQPGGSRPVIEFLGNVPEHDRFPHHRPDSWRHDLPAKLEKRIADAMGMFVRRRERRSRYRRQYQTPSPRRPPERVCSEIKTS
jgi:hypothetical protein